MQVSELLSYSNVKASVPSIVVVIRSHSNKIEIKQQNNVICNITVMLNCNVSLIESNHSYQILVDLAWIVSHQIKNVKISFIQQNHGELNTDHKEPIRTSPNV